MLSKEAQKLKQIATMNISDDIQKGFISDNDIRRHVSDMQHILHVSNEEAEEVIHQLLKMYEVTMEVGVSITDEETRNSRWFTDKKRNQQISDKYYERFSLYMLHEKKWNTLVLSKLDQRTDDILNFIGDPTTENEWLRKGLLIGDVQSGKTINYTAICNKAADAGYKVIILLTGTIESLRRQTQVRLLTDFIGKATYVNNGGQKNAQIGVGVFNPNLDVVSFTSEVKDFDRNFIRQNNLSLTALNSPAIFVVKKNKSVLNNLNGWLKHFNSKNNNKIDLPLLVIDDESDNASINTKEEFSPTAINAGIRMLLNNFTKRTYLAVTATPFANIFIDDEHNNVEVGDDLFPEHFIYLLDPPSSYIGSEKLFSEDSEHAGNLIEIQEDESFTYAHKKNDSVENLPLDIEDALIYFLLSNAVLDSNQNIELKHRSMLVNVSRFIDIQNQVHDLIVEWLGIYKHQIQHYSQLSDLELTKNKYFNRLLDVWTRFELTNISGLSWHEIRTGYLHDSTKKIETRVVNLRSQKKLDYQDYLDGLRVIAVGGNSLSRGLTLEGLLTSYFYRNSKMYDTLMQMGRWFGYRDGYESLFKVWMSKEAIQWYSHITNATNELKNDIIKMNRSNLTPKQFGLMVQQHPDTLIITAPNKMKNTGEYLRQISLSSTLIETPRLVNEMDTLMQNNRVCETFVKSLSNDMRRSDDNKKLVFYDIGRQEILDLINNFQVHPWELKFNAKALTEFIASNPLLELWDVYIPSVKNETDLPIEITTSDACFNIGVQKRKILVGEYNELLLSGTKVRVGTQGTTRAGLSEDQQLKIQKLAEDAGLKSASDKAYLSIKRKPLLVLHYISPDIESDRKYRGPIFVNAIGLGFPLIEEGSRVVSYRTNTVELKKNTSCLELDGDDDYEEE